MLSNAKWEAFAQGLYEGENQVDAYVGAGYARSDAAASKLAKNGKVQARLAELQERGQRMTDMTKERLTEMLLQDRDDARENGQYSAAISAVEKVGKLHGLFIEKSENVNRNYVISDEPESDTVDWLSSHAPN